MKMTRNLTAAAVLVTLLLGTILLLMVVAFVFQMSGFLKAFVALIVAFAIWLIVAFPLAYFVLAPQNLFFTFIKEGTAKFVVRGDKFHNCLMQWESYTFDYSKRHPEKWNIVPESAGHPPEKHLLGGLRFYGPWPLDDIAVHKFQWTGITEGGKENPKKEWLDYILLKDDVYLCKVPDAEDKNLLQLELQIFLTIRVINPYKAQFAVQQWLEAVINRTQPMLRRYVAQFSYEELLPKKQEAGGEIWNDLVSAGLLGETGEFCSRYGVEVRAIEIAQINPPDEWRKTTLLRFTAEKEAEAIVAKAKGNKQAMITEAEGNKERIKMVYEQINALGDVGKLIRTLEAAEKSTLAASLTVQAVPGLQEMFRGIFGKPVEEATLKELKELREKLEALEAPKK